ncbi:MAG: hypothetical protein AAB571_00805 [Chloroflexota bacterium]
MLNRFSKWTWGVIALTLARAIMIALMFLDVPKLDYHVGWAFYHGGDEFLYFKVANDILAGKFLFTTVSGGWAFVVALATWLTQADHYEATLPVLTPLNGIFLSVCSVWLVARLTRLLTADDSQSLLAAAVWTFSPYLLWVAFSFFPKAMALQNVYVPRQLWLNGLTDAPSIFLVMLGAVLLLKAHQTQNANRLIWIGSGVMFGLALSIRIHTLAMIAPMWFALLLARRWRELLWVVLGSVIGFAPQFVYNGLVGNIFDTPYIRNWLRPQNGGISFEWNNTPFSPRFLLSNLITITRGNILLMIVGVAAAGAAAFAFVRAWRLRGGVEAIIMFVAPLASFGLHVTAYLFLDDPIRFSMPAITLGLPAMVWTLFARPTRS